MATLGFEYGGLAGMRVPVLHPAIANQPKFFGAAWSGPVVDAGRVVESQAKGVVNSATSIVFAPPSVATFSDSGRTGFGTGDSKLRHMLREKLHQQFVEVAREENFEYGYTQPSERLAKQIAKDVPGVFGDVVQGILLRESADPVVMVALLNAVASLPYEMVWPFGQTLAIAAIALPAIEVKDAAIRAYETWGHPEGVGILKNIECPWPWLDDYRKQVIADLGGEP